MLRRAFLTGAGALALAAGIDLPAQATGWWLRVGTSPAPPTPPRNYITPAGGDHSIPTASAVVHGSGCTQTATGTFDIWQDAWIEDEVTDVVVGAGIDDRSWISSVIFYLNGNAVEVTTQTESLLNPGVYGWRVTPKTGLGTDDDYILYAKIIPVNGYETVISRRIVLNSNATITRTIKYVDYGTGSDSTGTGAIGNPWKTIGKGLSSVTSGSIIECAVNNGAGTIIDANGPTNNTVARMITVRPKSGLGLVLGDIVVRKVDRSTTAIYTVRGSKTEFKDLSFDMAYYVQIQAQLVASTNTLVFNHCWLNDSNGVSGPATGYSNFNTDFANTTFVGGGNQFYALVNCLATSYCMTGWTLLLNSALTVSADAVFMGVLQTQVGIFNSTATQASIMYLRQHTNTFLTVASSTYDGVHTTINWSGTPTFAGISNDLTNCFVAKLGDDPATQGAVFHSQVAGVTQVNGNWTATFTPGTSAWIAFIFHADAFQWNGAASASTITQGAAQQVYAQRYKAVGPRFQPVFSQPGPTSATTPSTNTITITSVTGLAVVCSSTASLIPNYFLKLTSGANSGQYARVASVEDATHCTLAYAFPGGNQSGVTAQVGRNAKDVIMVSCIFDHTGPTLEVSQWQGGQQNWVMLQCTHLGCLASIRNSSIGFGLEAFGMWDSVWKSMAADSAFPTVGVDIDNNQFQSGSPQGTNAVVGAMTFDATYHPTAGLTKTIGRTPLFPWSYDGVALTSASLIGAQQAP